MAAKSVWLRRAGFGLAALVVLVLLLVAAGLMLAERRMQRQVPVNPKEVSLPQGAEALERGRYLFASRGCVDCHGANGAGRVFAEGGGLRIVGPNITAGPGGATARYTMVDWVRTLRHGVKPDGRPARIMPSEDYNRLTDADVGALIAWVRQLPPVSGLRAEVELPLPARVLLGFGLIDDAAAKIDHSLPPATPVAEGVTVQHGAYVANMCLGCHGAQFAGGRIPGGPPDWPPAADLRPGGLMSTRYAKVDDFVRMFKTGRNPQGAAIAVMPFESLRELKETDVQALHLYLASLKTQAAR